MFEAVGKQIIGASFCFPDPQLFEETILALASVSIAAENDKQSRGLHIVENPLLLIGQAQCESFGQHCSSHPVDCLHPNDRPCVESQILARDGAIPVIDAAHMLPHIRIVRVDPIVDQNRITVPSKGSTFEESIGVDVDCHRFMHLASLIS